VSNSDDAIRALVEMSRLFADDAADPAEVPRVLVNIANRHLGPDVVAVYVTGSDGSASLANSAGSAPPALLEGEPGYGLGLEAVLTLPLVSGGDLFGTLVLGWQKEPGPAADRLAAGLADIAATALARSHRTRELIEVIRALEESRRELARTESLRQLGQMAAVVAHEVKNPLASIGGVLQVLRTRTSNESPDHGILGKVLDRLSELDQLVDELLRFARPRDPVLSTVSLHAFVNEVVALFKQDPASRSITVSIRTEDGNLTLDRAMMQRVVLNLLLNAAQAMGAVGEIELTGHAGPLGAQLTVRDQGPGIPPELSARVFEPFYTTKVRGTGLGLAVARQAVEAHHGTITVAESEGSGASFVIRLPPNAGR
jgi:two-component system, NtrC family, sensor histidine kinase HydH